MNNVSDSDAKVVLIYDGIRRKDGEIKCARSEIDVAKGKTHYPSGKLIIRVFFNVREMTDRIKIALANGKKLGLKSPVGGITDSAADWLFFVENNQIQSVGPTAKFAK